MQTMRGPTWLLAYLFNVSNWPSYFLGPLYPARLAFFSASNMAPGDISTVVFVSRI